LVKRPGETIYAWFDRLEKYAAVTIERGKIQSIIALHYRHRFSAEGLDADGQEKLALSVAAVLQERLSRAVSPVK